MPQFKSPMDFEISALTGIFSSLALPFFLPLAGAAWATLAIQSTTTPIRDQTDERFMREPPARSSPAPTLRYTVVDVQESLKRPRHVTREPLESFPHELRRSLDDRAESDLILASSAHVSPCGDDNSARHAVEVPVGACAECTRRPPQLAAESRG